MRQRIRQMHPAGGGKAGDFKGFKVVKVLKVLKVVKDIKVPKPIPRNLAFSPPPRPNRAPATPRRATP